MMAKRKLEEQAPVLGSKKQKTTAAASAPAHQKMKNSKSKPAQASKKTQQHNNNRVFANTSAAKNGKQKLDQTVSTTAQPQSKKRKADDHATERDAKRSKMELRNSGSAVKEVKRGGGANKKTVSMTQEDNAKIKKPIGEPYKTIKGTARFTTAVNQQLSQRGLFKLPAELREMVYEYVVPQRGNIPIKQKSPSAVIMEKVPLLFTCKKVYGECIEMFYEKNAFEADSTDILNGWLKALEPLELRKLERVWLADPAKPDNEKTSVEHELQAAGRDLAALRRARLMPTLTKKQKKQLAVEDAEAAAFEGMKAADRIKRRHIQWMPTIEHPRTGEDLRGPYTLRRVRRTLESIRNAVGRKGLRTNVVYMELNITNTWYDTQYQTFRPENHHKFYWVSAEYVAPTTAAACPIKTDNNPSSRREKYTRFKSEQERVQDQAAREKRKKEADAAKIKRRELTLAQQQASAARKAAQKARKAEKAARQ